MEDNEEMEEIVAEDRLMAEEIQIESPLEILRRAAFYHDNAEVI